MISQSRRRQLRERIWTEFDIMLHSNDTIIDADDYTPDEKQYLDQLIEKIEQLLLGE